jgi:hypothetical protein
MSPWELFFVLVGAVVFLTVVKLLLIVVLTAYVANHSERKSDDSNAR